MRSTGQETAEHFQHIVADLLELPTGSGDAEVRMALLVKGPDFVAWYDNRLKAIAESKQPKLRAAETHTAAQCTTRRH